MSEEATTATAAPTQTTSATSSSTSIIGQATTEQVATKGTQAAPALAKPADTQLPGWMSSLPDELKSEASLKLHQNVDSLAKSYVSAQKMIGAEKIAVPSQHATADDWKNVFQKLGLPANEADYKLNGVDGVQFDEGFLKTFKEKAFAAGILPKQAQALLGWWGEESIKQLTNAEEAGKAARDKAINSIKAEWGDGFEYQTSKARIAVEEMMKGDETKALLKFLDEAKIDGVELGSHPQMLKMLAKVGDLIGEDKIRGNPSVASFRMTPAEAQQKQNEIYMDKTHPFNIAGHPNHDAAVQEMFELTKVKNSGMNGKSLRF
jgi:hypothetical protein